MPQFKEQPSTPPLLPYQQQQLRMHYDIKYYLAAICWYMCVCVRVHASSFCGFLCLWQMNLNATLGKLISNTTALTGTYAYITVNKCILVYIYTFIYTATILYASRLFSPSLANRLTMNLTMSSLLSHLALVRCQLYPSWTFIFRFAISLLYVACCNVAVCGTYVACFCG